MMTTADERRVSICADADPARRHPATGPGCFPKSRSSTTSAEAPGSRRLFGQRAATTSASGCTPYSQTTRPASLLVLTTDVGETATRR